jgi:hypothetical protein
MPGADQPVGEPGHDRHVQPGCVCYLHRPRAPEIGQGRGHAELRKGNRAVEDVEAASGWVAARWPAAQELNPTSRIPSPRCGQRPLRLSRQARRLSAPIGVDDAAGDLLVYTQLA